MPVITCAEDFQRLYRRRVPKMFHDYAVSGSYTESTLGRNEADFKRILIRQRVGNDVSDVNTSATMVGEAAALPAAFAPVGMLGIQRAGGEILVAKAAEAFGVPFVLSTMSICSIEQVAEATNKPFWFQLYVVKDRDFVRDLIHRAKAAGCSALVVTMDLPVLGQRHQDVKNGLSIRPNLHNLLNIATKPRWAMQMAKTPYKTFGNVIGHAKGVDNLDSLLSWAAESVDPSLDWADVEWIAKEWGGPIILKGILDAEDARIGADMDAAALVVSNHGGRQLDGAASTISALPSIVEAVGERTEVIVDSGVRTGMDIYRARALGASGVLLGRSMVYALGANGQDGVSTLLGLLQKELRVTMALAGKTLLSSVNAEDVTIPSSWE
jgi:L-lactate dehydrogenase (cytochrome)